jgi:quercetin dioxygenase-like cupin family protein
MGTITPAAATSRVFHRPAGSGRMYWGPGDLYTFLVTGEESGGAFFAMEALVPPGGGPPPHTHRHEDETFYVLEGACDFRLGDDTITAGVGDFVHVPRGHVHCFTNRGTAPARLILTFTPAGIERFFEETLQRAFDPTLDPPEDPATVGARYAAAGPRYGIDFRVA